MQTFEVRRTIKAPPARVWARLTDAPALVSGDLGILRLEGRIAPGERLSLTSEAAPRRAFVLHVHEFAPERRMVWTGGLPLGLFTGVREFTLSPSTQGTEFHMRETFRGPLAGLIGRTMPDLTPSFEKFADGLRAMAEEEGA
ncbi:MAG: SRPBCC domain-containing protein [Vicinamibacterales bacterium]